MRNQSAEGYRVIAPDQIGFGKSSKPEIRYTFATLSNNAIRLLDHLKVSRAAIVANSMSVQHSGEYPRFAHVPTLTLPDHLRRPDLR